MKIKNNIYLFYKNFYVSYSLVFLKYNTIFLLIFALVYNKVLIVSAEVTFLIQEDIPVLTKSDSSNIIPYGNWVQTGENNYVLVEPQDKNIHPTGLIHAAASNIAVSNPSSIVEHHKEVPPQNNHIGLAYAARSHIAVRDPSSMEYNEFNTAMLQSQRYKLDFVDLNSLRDKEVHYPQQHPQPQPPQVADTLSMQQQMFIITDLLYTASLKMTDMEEISSEIIKQTILNTLNEANKDSWIATTSAEITNSNSKTGQLIRALKTLIEEDPQLKPNTIAREVAIHLQVGIHMFTNLNGTASNILEFTFVKDNFDILYHKLYLQYKSHYNE